MEDFARTTLVSRKAEESAWRRYQATAWLESLVGPLHFSSRPTEKEFLSRLRNGLILCNVINKVYPGAVSKVVDNHQSLQFQNREFQPLPAYQYFENIRNFLSAVSKLKLPGFEASDLERDSSEEGSASNVVDCILGLKVFYESKRYKTTGGVMKQSTSSGTNSDYFLRLNTNVSTDDRNQKEDVIREEFASQISESKENIDSDRLKFALGDVEMFKSILQEFVKERTTSTRPPSNPLQTLYNVRDHVPAKQCCASCMKASNCDRRYLLQAQENRLAELKALLRAAKKELLSLQTNFYSDLTKLGIQVLEMSSAAQGYQTVMKENERLFNMVQDLKAKNAKTLMLNSESDSYGETPSTPKFSQSGELEAAHSNKEIAELVQLKEQVEILKKAVTIKEATFGQFNLMIERTPPRPRRLSVENSPGNIVKQKTPNLCRPRRLSSECPTAGLRQSKACRQPFSVAPESKEYDHNDNTLSNEATKKGSHLKKSLRAIGKMINGTEKRPQHIMKLSSPANISQERIDGRVLRRQSLTGVPLPVPSQSRRSSLGGKPMLAPMTPPSGGRKRWL